MQIFPCIITKKTEFPEPTLSFTIAGNELSGSGIGASVDADLYGKDAIDLNALLDQLYKNIRPKPLLLAPGGFFDKVWFGKLLDVSGPSTVNALTHHIYNLGPGKLDKFSIP